MDFGDPRLPEAFWRKIVLTPGCWMWGGATNSDGYGWFRHRAAHRIMAEADGQKIAGKDVRHKCDVNACVNPSHLVAGTTRDNIRDMIRKRRDAKNPTFRNRHAINCRRGHRLSGDNVYIQRSGKRRCRACARQTRLAQREKANLRPDRVGEESPSALGSSGPTTRREHPQIRIR